MKLIYKIIISCFAAFILGALNLWLIQSQVCNELADIMRNDSQYNIFTGCVITVETQAMDLKETK